MSPSLISGSGEDGCLDSWAGVEEWGHMGCYNPVEDVSTYKGCEQCQLTALCCQLARPALHIERLSCSAHWAPWAPRSQRASESFMFSLQLASICTTHILWCTVRRFRGKTSISAEWNCCSLALLAVDTRLQFRLHHQPNTLPLSSLSASDRLMFSQSDWDAGTYKQKKRENGRPTLSISGCYTSPHQHQPAKTEWSEVGVCWLKDRNCLCSSHIFHQHWNSPPFLGING